MRSGSWPSLFLTLAFAVLIAACHGKTIVLVADFAREFSVSPAQASWLVSGVAVVAALASPLVNWAVTRLGERKSIALGLLVAGSSSYLGSLVHDFSTFLALRVVEGAGYITVVLAALALIVHTTEGRRRTTALAFWSVASPLGGAIAIFAVSPYVGGQWRVAFLGHALVLFLLLLAVPLLPQANLARQGERKRFQDIFAIYRRPAALRLALAVAAPLTVALGLVTIVPAYFIGQLQIAPATIGVISTVAILSSVVAGILAGFILNLRWGAYGVVAAAVVAVSLEILVFIPGIGATAAIAAKVIQGFFSSFVVAWVFTSIPRMASGGDVVGAGGIAEQALYLSMFLGPVLLYPLFALENRLPFFAVLVVANLLPLILLPLGLRGNADTGVPEAAGIPEPLPQETA